MTMISKLYNRAIILLLIIFLSFNFTLIFKQQENQSIIQDDNDVETFNGFRYRDPKVKSKLLSLAGKGTAGASSGASSGASMEVPDGLVPEVVLELQESLIKEAIIPKVIWTFWNKEPIPPFMTNCIKTWSRSNPQYQINVVTRSKLSKILDLELVPIPKHFNDLSPQYQADWVRLAVLTLYGGIWVDASFIMTASLDFLHAIQERENTEGFQFYLKEFTTIPEFPYYENWFIAAVPHSLYITKWFLEWTFCIEEFKTKDSYLDHLQNEFGKEAYTSLLQANNDPSYLKQHIALQKVIQIDKAPLPSGLSAVSKPYGPFWLIHSFDWASYRVADSLVVKRLRPSPDPYFIKLRSFERDLTLMQLAQGWDWAWNFGWWNFWRKRFWAVDCGSLYCDYIGLDDPQCLEKCNKTF